MAIFFFISPPEYIIYNIYSEKDRNPHNKKPEEDVEF